MANQCDCVMRHVKKEYPVCAVFSLKKQFKLSICQSEESYFVDMEITKLTLEVINFSLCPKKIVVCSKKNESYTQLSSPFTPIPNNITN